jgi:hypothetical protein
MVSFAFVLSLCWVCFVCLTKIFGQSFHIGCCPNQELGSLFSPLSRYRMGSRPGPSWESRSNNRASEAWCWKESEFKDGYMCLGRASGGVLGWINRKGVCVLHEEAWKTGTEQNWWGDEQGASGWWLSGHMDPQTQNPSCLSSFFSH